MNRHVINNNMQFTLIYAFIHENLLPKVIAHQAFTIAACGRNNGNIYKILFLRNAKPLLCDFHDILPNF